MTAKILACVVAVAGAAALTLATTVALVRVTILAVSVDDLLLRVVAISADILVGTLLLVGCLYLATHLAVRILGVGDAEFPPLPNEARASDALPADPSKN